MSDDDQLVTRRASVPALIEAALRDVLIALNKLPMDATVRELRKKADSFERVLQTWNRVAPTSTQIETMRDLVSHLLDEALKTVSEARHDEPSLEESAHTVTPPERGGP